MLTTHSPVLIDFSLQRVDFSSSIRAFIPFNKMVFVPSFVVKRRQSAAKILSIRRLVFLFEIVSEFPTGGAILSIILNASFILLLIFMFGFVHSVKRKFSK